MFFHVSNCYGVATYFCKFVSFAIAGCDQITRANFNYMEHSTYDHHMVKKLKTYRRALIFGTHVLWVDGTGERIFFFVKDPEVFHSWFTAKTGNGTISQEREQIERQSNFWLLRKRAQVAHKSLVRRCFAPYGACICRLQKKRD